MFLKETFTFLPLCIPNQKGNKLNLILNTQLPFSDTNTVYWNKFYNSSSKVFSLILILSMFLKEAITFLSHCILNQTDGSQDLFTLCVSFSGLTNKYEAKSSFVWFNWNSFIYILLKYQLSIFLPLHLLLLNVTSPTFLFKIKSMYILLLTFLGE